jgi:hypothetical protein
MKEKPTTFQLAQLAAQAAPNTRAKDAVRRALELWSEAETGIAEYENRRGFLHGLFHAPGGGEIPIFADSPEDWQARLKAYPGDERDVQRALWDQAFPAEAVAKQLFRDRTLSKEARRKLLVGLARACIRFDMEGPLVAHRGRLNYLEGGEFIAPEPGFPIHPKNLERAKAKGHLWGPRWIPGKEVWFVKEVEGLLSQPKLYAHLVRWAVEVRQRQLAESKARVIPESLRQRREESGRDESIQFKRTFRQ